MKKLYTALVLALFSTGAFAQYTPLAGAHAPSVHPGIIHTSTATYEQYQLTTTSPIEQAGAVWRDASLNLTSNWTIKAQVNLGPFDETNLDGTKSGIFTSGADGIGIVLATGQYLGGWGEEVGYGTRVFPGNLYTPNNSLAFEMDTWKNETSGFNGAEGYLDHNERNGNHVAFMSRGNTVHPALPPAPPPPAFPAIGTLRQLTFDLETAGWIDVEISWTDATNTLAITSPSHPNLTSSIVLSDADLMTIFGSATPTLFLGFTASTGSAGNNHAVRWLKNAPPPPPACGQLRTQTQGGWGQDCSDLSKNNPGCYLANNFAAIGSVRIGSTAPGGRSLLFTSADAVADFLPSGGPNRTLAQLGLPAGTTTNPSGANAASGRSNINGQLLALSVSVALDNAIPSFGPAPINLDDMIIGSGPFAGQTVGAFLAYANNYIGGSGTDATIISNIQETAGNINENYVDGTKDGGYLVCPTTSRVMPSVQTMATIEDIAQPAATAATVYPNPSRGQLNVNLAKLPAGSEIQVVNARGTVVARRLAGGAQSLSFDVHQYGTGVYMIKVISEGKVQTLKALVQE